MYVKYAESQGFKTELMDAEESEAGGSISSYGACGNSNHATKRKLKLNSDDRKACLVQIS